MIRIALLVALLATPAAAEQYRIVGGANAPTIAVQEGDTLVTSKELVEDTQADGTLKRRYPVWVDRTRPAGDNGFQITADGLRLVGFEPGNGYVYAVVGAPARQSDVLFGANLSGAEANGGDSIRPSAEDWRGYIERHGFKLIRYPFIDTRMTPPRIEELKANVAYANGKGVSVILDNHTYRWDAPDKSIAFWTGFARNFPDDGSVMLDLVNEPRGFNDPVLTNDWEQWLRDSNLIIAGLRANGIKHPILLEYPQWSATFRFDKGEGPRKATESAGIAIDRGGGLKDPLGLTFINGHRYFDRGSSGTSKECVDVKSGFVEFAAQLRKRGLKAYITESAFGSHYGVKASCAVVSAEAIAALRANSDVIKGITWWGGGRIWPESYIFKIDPPKAVRFTAPTSAYVERLTGK